MPLVNKRRVLEIYDAVVSKREFLVSLLDALNSGSAIELRDRLDSWEATADVDSTPGLREKLIAAKAKLEGKG